MPTVEHSPGEIITEDGTVFYYDPDFFDTIKTFKCWSVTKQGRIYTMVPKARSETGFQETILLHQLVMNLHYKIPLCDKTYVEWGYQIDHINHDLRNNCISNLQYLPAGLNNSKRSRGLSSGFNGVYWNKNAGKWEAHYKKDGKMHFIGLFDDEEAAARAFDDKMRELGLDKERLLNYDM